MSPCSGRLILLCLLLVACAAASDGDRTRTQSVESILLGDDGSLGQRNTCAMTRVLQAMNELLTVLSTEIRELKTDVQTNCKSKEGRGGGRSEGRRPETRGRDEGRRPTIPKQEETEEDEVDDIFSNFGKSEDLPQDEDDYDEVGDEYKGPDLIEGLTNWWGSIVPFQPTDEPSTSTTQASAPAYPRDPYDYGRDRETVDADDSYDSVHDPYAVTQNNYVDRYEPGHDGGFYGSKDSDKDYYRPNPQPITTEPTLSYPVPPEPTSCPAHFQRQAGGCYLIFYDQSVWRSWGEAHAFCQTYGGSLAAPYRLDELRSFLSRTYSHAFWVGAMYDRSGGSWKWLSGREVEASAWKPGQPSSNPSMNCVYLEKWSDYRASNHYCGEKYPFICDYREPLDY